MNDPQKVPHPSTKGQGMVIIYTANQIELWAKRIEAVLISERKNRIKKFERLLAKSTLENKKLVDEFWHKPKTDTYKKLTEAFKGMQSLEFFKSN